MELNKYTEQLTNTQHCTEGMHDDQIGVIISMIPHFAIRAIPPNHIEVSHWPS